MDGRRHAGFEATTKIKRSDWGLTWNVGLEAGGWLVSDEVTIEIEVAADELAAVTAGAAASGRRRLTRAAPCASAERRAPSPGARWISRSGQQRRARCSRPR